MWKVYGIMFLVVVVIAVFWVRGIDNMMKNYPDYKGEDCLNWGDDKKEEKKDE
jgi:hypothetical protein